MNKIDTYVHAGTRENTRRSYQAAARHFEIEWGGFLPATSDAIARYLADNAENFAINTLRQRLAALAQWHIEQGFPDPTKAPVVRKVFRGIQALHPSQEKRAKPMQIEQLAQVTKWLDAAIALANTEGDTAMQLRHTRDKALLLLGFWRGFRGDELTRLRVEFIEIVPLEGMTCFLPQTKGDRSHQGTSFRTPVMTTLCPVDAYCKWIDLASLREGPVFRGIDRWGHISPDGLHINSLIPLLRLLFARADISFATHYSGHSLRRGFAQWATSNGWDIKTLMQYVGWKNVNSALRYVESADPFARPAVSALAIQTVSSDPSIKENQCPNL